MDTKNFKKKLIILLIIILIILFIYTIYLLFTNFILDNPYPDEKTNILLTNKKENFYSFGSILALLDSLTTTTQPSTTLPTTTQPSTTLQTTTQPSTTQPSTTLPTTTQPSITLPTTTQPSTTLQTTTQPSTTQPNITNTKSFIFMPVSTTNPLPTKMDCKINGNEYYCNLNNKCIYLNNNCKNISEFENDFPDYPNKKNNYTCTFYKTNIKDDTILSKNDAYKYELNCRLGNEKYLIKNASFENDCIINDCNIISYANNINNDYNIKKNNVWQFDYGFSKTLPIDSKLSNKINTKTKTGELYLTDITNKKVVIPYDVNDYFNYNNTDEETNTVNNQLKSLKNVIEYNKARSFVDLQDSNQNIKLSQNNLIKIF